MKNINLIVTLAIVIILAVGGITVVSSYFSYNNKEISLREQAEAQRGKVEGVHDAMWKIISQRRRYLTNTEKASTPSIRTSLKVVTPRETEP